MIYVKPQQKAKKAECGGPELLLLDMSRYGAGAR